MTKNIFTSLTELDTVKALEWLSDHIEKNNWEHLYLNVPHIAKMNARLQNERQKVVLFKHLMNYAEGSFMKLENLEANEIKIERDEK